MSRTHNMPYRPQQVHAQSPGLRAACVAVLDSPGLLHGRANIRPAPVMNASARTPDHKLL